VKAMRSLCAGQLEIKIAQGLHIIARTDLSEGKLIVDCERPLKGLIEQDYRGR
jgi:hypothetical protein